MRFNLYAHTGSKNHGCEAIVRSTIQINGKYHFNLFSGDVEGDILYGVNEICTIYKQGKNIIPKSLVHCYLKVISILQGNKNCYSKYIYGNLMGCVQKNDIHFSIGGDMYCYNSSFDTMLYLNRKIKENNFKMILWGCSIEPELLKNEALIDDLKQYSLITPRESITYNALIKAGIDKNTKIYPDPAFTLKTVNLDLPKGFDEKNTIGINTSPLILGYEKHKGSTMNNYIALLQHIIETTNMQIALIPHVVREDNDDQEPLKELYTRFKDTGRVILIPDGNCMELKGYIARCRMFIGARTHATIAAYSSGVPTLVVGYSVKSKGIAKDIFGTYENYVIPVQCLEHKEDLINAFNWMQENEERIKIYLKNFMPEYIERAWQSGNELEKIMQKQEL